MNKLLFGLMLVVGINSVQAANVCGTQSAGGGTYGSSYVKCPNGPVAVDANGRPLLVSKIGFPIVANVRLDPSIKLEYSK